jgi:hypothetical protein
VAADEGKRNGERRKNEAFFSLLSVGKQIKLDKALQYICTKYKDKQVSKAYIELKSHIWAVPWEIEALFAYQARFENCNLHKIG